MQDWLGLDGDSRMNVPSRPDNNWAWRVEKKALSSELIKKIANLVDVADRFPLKSGQAPKSPPAEQEQFAA